MIYIQNENDCLAWSLTLRYKDNFPLSLQIHEPVETIRNETRTIIWDLMIYIKTMIKEPKIEEWVKTFQA